LKVGDTGFHLFLIVCFSTRQFVSIYFVFTFMLSQFDENGDDIPNAVDNLVGEDFTSRTLFEITVNLRRFSPRQIYTLLNHT
jgi:hypothetical protein